MAQVKDISTKAGTSSTSITFSSGIRDYPTAHHLSIEGEFVR